LGFQVRARARVRVRARVTVGVRPYGEAAACVGLEVG
jgi:hypothetical protein